MCLPPSFCRLLLEDKHSIEETKNRVEEKISNARQNHSPTSLQRPSSASKANPQSECITITNENKENEGIITLDLQEGSSLDRNLTESSAQSDLFLETKLETIECSYNGDGKEMQDTKEVIKA